MKNKKRKSLELEQGVLAGLLLEPKYMKYVEFLSENDFTTDYNKLIWNRMTNSKTFDPLTIAAGEKQDFKDYVVSLYDCIPSGENTQEYARILRERTRERLLSTKIHSVIKDMAEDSIDLDSAITSLNMGIDEVNSLTLSQISTQQEVVKETYEELLNPSKKKSFQTGLQSFDSNIKLRSANMYVLGASTGIGKSSFAINLAMRISKSNNAKVLFYALEMDKKDVYRKMISHLSHIPDRKLSNEDRKLSNGDKNAIKLATNKLMSDYQIRVHDDYGIDISLLKNQISELVIKHELDFVIIDQLSLISVKGNRFKMERDRMKYISWEIRKLSGELDIPIIALVQLNRASEDSSANISHIAESFDIARDASAVMLLDTDRNDYNETKQYNLNVVKNRFGRLCCIPLIVSQATLEFNEGSCLDDEDAPF